MKAKIFYYIISYWICFELFMSSYQNIKLTRWNNAVGGEILLLVLPILIAFLTQELRSIAKENTNENAHVQSTRGARNRHKSSRNTRRNIILGGSQQIKQH